MCIRDRRRTAITQYTFVSLRSLPTEYSRLLIRRINDTKWLVLRTSSYQIEIVYAIDLIILIIIIIIKGHALALFKS